MTPKRRAISNMFNPMRGLRPVPGTRLPFRPRLPGAPLIGRRAPAKVYGRIGNLEVRLARTKGDLKRAQKLRYRVFYEEMSAIPDAMAMLSRRDEDPFDPLCDHLLVIDHGAASKSRRPWSRRPRIVGTYRILRQDVAELNDGFYSQGEYNIAPMLAALGHDCRVMELGRSCVLKPYRNRRTIELLWQGIWTYARENRIDAMIGCASFEGTDPQRHAEALSYLHHHSRAPERWRVRAHENIHVDMNMMPASQLDMKRAIRAMPPLIKGYLKVGAFVGDGAVVDHQFGTTDVFVVLPVESINERYFAHFGAPDELAGDAAPSTQLN